MSFLEIPELDGFQAYVDNPLGRTFSTLDQYTQEGYSLTDSLLFENGGLPEHLSELQPPSFEAQVNSAFLSEREVSETLAVPPPQDGEYTTEYVLENGQVYEGKYVVEAVPSEPTLLEPPPAQDQQTTLTHSGSRRVSASKDPAIKARVAAMRKERSPVPAADNRKKLQPTTSVAQQVTPDNHLFQFGDTTKPFISRKRSNSLPNVNPECKYPCFFVFVFFPFFSCFPLNFQWFTFFSLFQCQFTCSHP